MQLAVERQGEQVEITRSEVVRNCGDVVVKRIHFHNGILGVMERRVFRVVTSSGECLFEVKAKQQSEFEDFVEVPGGQVLLVYGEGVLFLLDIANPKAMALRGSLDLGEPRNVGGHEGVV